jgi:hypothetical protein
MKIESYQKKLKQIISEIEIYKNFFPRTLAEKYAKDALIEEMIKQRRDLKRKIKQKMRGAINQERARLLGLFELNK